jgi:hypothetical protein
LISIARSICAAAFVAMIWFVERTVCVLFDRSRHLFAIIAAGSSCAFIHHAHIATAQAVTFMLMAASYWAIADTIRTHSTASYYRLALLCGLAVGSKYNAIFLGASALPVILWYVQRASGGWKLFVPRLLSTPVVCAAGVLGTNPYIALNYAKFQKDVLDVAIKEAPHFQSAVSGFWKLLRFFGGAFFTPLGFALMAVATVLSVAVVAYAKVTRCNSHPKLADPMQRWGVFSCVLLLTMAGFMAMQYSIAIHQSRYYIPVGLQFLLLFLTSSTLAMKVLESWLDGWHWRIVKYGVALPGGAVVGLLLLVNGFLHVAAFPLSASETAARYLRSKAANEGASLTVLSVAKRSPVLLNEVCTVACGRVVVGVSPPENVQTWDDYLEWIITELRNLDPSYVAMEDIVFHWPILLPRALEQDYSRRFDFPNPGLQRWIEVLQGSGYELDQKFPRTALEGSFIRWLNPRLSSTIEGIGGQVYIFRRAEATVAR